MPSVLVHCLALALLVALCLRGHVAQAFGLTIECQHPGEVPVAHNDGESANDEDDRGSEAGDGTSSADLDTIARGAKHAPDDCPANCPRCPRGQMPMLAPTMDLVALGWFDVDELTHPEPKTKATLAPHDRLDRPPRPTRA